jgi:hypothetical protein
VQGPEFKLVLPKKKRWRRKGSFFLIIKVLQLPIRVNLFKKSVIPNFYNHIHPHIHTEYESLRIHEFPLPTTLYEGSTLSVTLLAVLAIDDI